MQPLCPQKPRDALPVPISPTPHVAGTPVSAALSPQDMADYVAYVAKDPINQRGEASGGGWGRGLDLQPVETQLMLPDDP